MGDSRLLPDESGKDKTNGTNPFQVNLVDVAQVERTGDKDKGAQPWRRTWGEVAPAAQDLPPVNPKMDQNPNLNGGNGVPPWRAQPGVAPIVPGAPGDKPQDKPNPGGGNPNPGGGDVPDWKDHIRDNKPVDEPGFVDPNRGGPGGPGSPLTQEQLDIINKTKKPQSSVLGYIWTGGITGAAVKSGTYGMDAWLMSTTPEQRNGLLRAWEKISPAQKIVQERTDLFADAQKTFGIKNAAHAGIETELSLLKPITDHIRVTANAEIGILEPIAKQNAILSQQKSFLQSLGTVQDPAAIRRVIGARGANGVLFETGSVAATTLEQQALHLEARLARTAAVAAPDLTGAMAEVDAGMRAIAQQRTWLGVNHAKLDFLQKGLAGDPTTVKSFIGTADEVAAGTKLFVQGSDDAVKLMAYAEKQKLHALATAELDAARAGMSSAESRLLAAQKAGAAEAHGGLLGTSMKGLAKGMLISGATLATGYAFDTYLMGNKNHMDGGGRFIMDGFVTPAILVSNMPMRYKLPMAALTFGGARAVDWWTGYGSGVSTNMWLRPNVVDHVGVTASILAPIPTKYKPFAVLGTLALGRGYNYIARQTGLDGYNNSADVLDTELSDLRNIDTTSQSVSSFDNSVAKAKQLGLSNPAVLEMRLVESMGRTNQHPVDQDRQTAALAYGLGLARLEKGSRLDVTDYTATAYHLTDKKYDFGCTAAEQLNSAVTSLERAAKWVKGHKGQTVNGRVMDDSYVQQLDELKGKVVTDLNKIYGEQNMGEVYETAKGLIQTNLQSVMRFIKDGGEKLQSLGAELSPTDVRYAAKLSRDLCIANLAYAEKCADSNNGVDARAFLLSAEEHIKNSEALEKSPNLIKMKEIIDRVRKKIPGATQRQFSNPVNNPWQLKPGK
jgi:hypothetical protein